MKNRTDILNEKIKQLGIKSYAQIGDRDGGKNFDGIQCPVKKTNDEAELVFFDINDFDTYVNIVHDAINNGCIVVIHNVVPKDEKHKSFDLCGDAYRFVDFLQDYESELHTEDHGLLFVYPVGIDNIPDMTLEDARAAYEAEYGKPPHGRMKLETILSKL